MFRHVRKHAQLWSRNPTENLRPSGHQHIFRVQDSASDESSAGSPFSGPPFQSIGIQKQTRSVRNYSGLKGSHEASNKRCTQYILAPVPNFCAKRHRESQEDRTPGQAAITWAPR